MEFWQYIDLPNEVWLKPILKLMCPSWGPSDRVQEELAQRKTCAAGGSQTGIKNGMRRVHRQSWELTHRCWRFREPFSQTMLSTQLSEYVDRNYQLQQLQFMGTHRERTQQIQKVVLSGKITPTGITPTWRWEWPLELTILQCLCTLF